MLIPLHLDKADITSILNYAEVLSNEFRTNKTPPQGLNEAEFRDLAKAMLMLKIQLQTHNF
jgi:hypothetical protein